MCLLRRMKGLSASLKCESQLYQNTLLVMKASRIQKIPWQFCSFTLWRAPVKVEPGRRATRDILVQCGHFGPSFLWSAGALRKEGEMSGEEKNEVISEGKGGGNEFCKKAGAVWSILREELHWRTRNSSMGKRKHNNPVTEQVLCESSGGLQEKNVSAPLGNGTQRDGRAQPRPNQRNKQKETWSHPQLLCDEFKYRAEIAVCSWADVCWGGRRALLSSSGTLMLLSALQRHFMRVHQLLLQDEESILKALFYILGLYLWSPYVPFLTDELREWIADSIL